MGQGTENDILLTLKILGVLSPLTFQRSRSLLIFSFEHLAAFNYRRHDTKTAAELTDM